MMYIRSPVTTQSDIFDFANNLGVFDIDKGPWIAGGAVRRAVHGEDTASGDIDIFLADPSQAAVFADLWGNENGREKRKGEGNLLFDFMVPHNGGEQAGGRLLRVQVIVWNTFASVEALLDDFDFTIARFATDGKTVVEHCDARSDHEARVIRIANASPRRNSMLRLAKYCKYGFTPSVGALTAASRVADPDLKLVPRSLVVANDHIY